MPDLISALAPRPEPKRSRFDWAEVTQANPLRIRLSSDTNPLDIEPTTNVLGLQVGDVVRVEITAQGQVVILGRRGGLAASNVPDLPASKVTSGTLDAARRWTGAPRAMAAGSVTITPTAINTPAAATVTFPAGRFATAPYVTVSPGTGDPEKVFTSWAMVTTSGFTVYLTRTNSASATAVNWIAVEV